MRSTLFMLTKQTMGRVLLMAGDPQRVALSIQCWHSKPGAVPVFLSKSRVECGRVPLPPSTSYLESWALRLFGGRYPFLKKLNT
jgi:hypothetical protein